MTGTTGQARSQVPSQRLRTMRSMGTSTHELNAGSLCLDFVSVAKELEETEDPKRSLREWFVDRGLPEPLGGVTDEDVTDAGVLAKSISSVARDLLDNRDPSPVAVRHINVRAEHPTPVFFLRGNGRRRQARGEIDARASWSVIARDAVHLFSSSDLLRLRLCGRPQCGVIFYDRSPAGRRRWCAMRGCGERVAAAAYRARQAMAAPGGPVPQTVEL